MGGESFIHLNAFSKMPTNKFSPRGSVDFSNSLDSPGTHTHTQSQAHTADCAAVTRSPAIEKERCNKCWAFKFCTLNMDTLSS